MSRNGRDRRAADEADGDLSGALALAGNELPAADGDATESMKMALPPRASTSFTEPSAAMVTWTRTVPLTFIFFRMSG